MDFLESAEVVGVEEESAHEEFKFMPGDTDFLKFADRAGHYAYCLALRMTYTH